MAKSEYSIYVRQYEKCSVVCVVTKKSTIAVVIEAEVTLNIIARISPSYRHHERACHKPFDGPVKDGL